MDRPYDAALKTLAELAPRDWLNLVKRRRRRVTVEDSDVGTVVSGATDKLFRVHDDPEYLLHLDFESGHFHAQLPLRLRLYNSLFEYRHRRVVLSVPVLLRPEADSPQWSGLLERGLPGEVPVSTLRYQVIRVWQLPAEELLSGGIGTMALAPISDVPEGEVPGIIRRMREKLGGPKPPRLANDVFAAAFVLPGLRYDVPTARSLFAGVLGMKESSTYQAILSEGREEGRAEEARRLLLLLGEPKLGSPDADVRAAIESITDPARLEELVVRQASVNTWQELLPSSARRRRNGRRRPRG